ncbi:hypothetical protein C0995_002676 [Termitomyces sp. Mi166|nr:hypothetical protein C0995_002676 [Termitomyces sp. Mi166\
MTQKEAKAALAKAKDDMAQYYDQEYTSALQYKQGNQLFPAPDDPILGCCSNPPPPPVLVDNKEEYEVEEILDSHLFQHKLQFKMKWKGYGIKDIF